MAIRFVIALMAVLMVPDSLVGQRTPGPAARQALQEQIVRRFVENYRMEAGLTDDQTRQFTQLLEQSFRERRQTDARLRELFRALEQQLRPGVAADVDSLTALMTDIRVARERQTALLNQQLDRFAEFLTPVQQGQLVLSLERLQRQIENILRRRGADARRPNP